MPSKLNLSKAVRTPTFPVVTERFSASYVPTDSVKTVCRRVLAFHDVDAETSPHDTTQYHAEQDLPFRVSGKTIERKVNIGAHMGAEFSVRAATL